MLSGRPWLPLGSLQTGSRQGQRRRWPVRRGGAGRRTQRARPRGRAQRGQREQGWQAQGRVEWPCHHSPSSLWGRGDRPCRAHPGTREGCDREAAAPEPCGFPEAGPSPRERVGRAEAPDSPPFLPDLSTQPAQSRRAWGCGAVGLWVFVLFFLMIFFLALLRAFGAPHQKAIKGPWGEAGGGTGGEVGQPGR